MKTRYIYFDKKTGVMTDILNKKKRGRAPYVTTDYDTIGPVIMGKKGWLDYVVAYDREQKKYILLERDNVIKLRYYGDGLYKIPKRTKEDYDLRIDVFSDGNAIEISLDPTRISTMYSTNFVKDVHFEKGTEIRIYIKDKNGEELFDTLIIDAQKLLENGVMFFELKETDVNNLSFHTERVFDNYMWRKVDSKFLSPMRDNVKFEVQKAHLKRKSELFEYHLVLNKTDDGLIIKNNIDNLKLVKLFEDVEFYIVDKYDPMLLYEKFVLPPDAFNSKTIVVDIKQQLEGKTILYNHKYISVLIEG